MYVFLFPRLFLLLPGGRRYPLPLFLFPSSSTFLSRHIGIYELIFYPLGPTPTAHTGLEPHSNILLIQSRPVLIRSSSWRISHTSLPTLHLRQPIYPRTLRQAHAVCWAWTLIHGPTLRRPHARQGFWCQCTHARSRLHGQHARSLDASSRSRGCRGRRISRCGTNAPFQRRCTHTLWQFTRNSWIWCRRTRRRRG